MAPFILKPIIISIINSFLSGEGNNNNKNNENSNGTYKIINDIINHNIINGNEYEYLIEWKNFKELTWVN